MTAAKRPTRRPTAARKTAAARPKAAAAAKPAAKPQAAARTRTAHPRPATNAPRKTAAKKTARAKPKPGLQEVVLAALADMKAVDIRAIDVRGFTDITDTMVVASGTSDRHVKSIADRVMQRCKEAGFKPFGTEGERDGEWVLVDLQDVVLHVMLPRVRQFYALEKLWEGGAAA
jgi:ribosome-associated protein